LERVKHLMKTSEHKDLLHAKEFQVDLLTRTLCFHKWTRKFKSVQLEVHTQVLQVHTQVFEQL
jgi:hypothetical protein